MFISILEEIGYSFLFLTGESFIDAQYSKNATDLYIISKDTAEFLKIKDVLKDRRFYAKIIKGILIGAALYKFADLSFAVKYISFRIIFFDAILSLIRFREFMPIKWYLENHITVRTIQFIKRKLSL